MVDAMDDAVMLWVARRRGVRGSFGGIATRAAGRRRVLRDGASSTVARVWVSERRSSQRVVQTPR